VSVTSAFARVQADMGAPDVLLYNAGFFQVAGVLEFAPAEFERAWRMNCFGALLVSQAVLPAMLERRRGTLLCTGASASLRGSARFAALAVGKFGLRALAQSMARELGPQGIHVAHVVVDGVIDTPRTRSMLAGREAPTMLAAAAIAQTFWSLYVQGPDRVDSRARPPPLRREVLRSRRTWYDRSRGHAHVQRRLAVLVAGRPRGLGICPLPHALRAGVSDARAPAHPLHRREHRLRE
jgi:NAD(P)-dependent dehydrogenase (short-subunit alcohol dehydrogenase family)